MSDVAIRVDGLGKRYHIGGPAEPYKTLREAIVRATGAPLRNFQRLRKVGGNRSSDEDNTIWALQDVTFDVKHGQVLGIIGRNGAGKSTLLKILSRITRPTTGSATVYGRVGSLLEVGTGFHPELTGRDNIYLNGSILGMDHSYIARRFDEIVEFSGVHKFIDTPVKRYSSGMYLRLAFAVAAHLEPDVLVVDEVLAVGDGEFQKKCMGKMGEVAREGRTVLFVSHNLEAISTLTRDAILLSHGRCVCRGDSRDVIATYLRTNRSSDPVYRSTSNPDRPHVSRIEVKTSRSGNLQFHCEPLEIHLHIKTPCAIDGARVSVRAVDVQQRPGLYLWAYDSEQPMCRQSGTHEVVFTIPKLRLYKGNFTLTVNFAERAGGGRFEVLEGVCPFEVVLGDVTREGGWMPNEGAYIEDFSWHSTRSDSTCEDPGHDHESDRP